MAMMIGKFHKMIQSKVVWYIVLGVIVVTFVFWGIGSTMSQNSASAQKAPPVGSLFGKDVSREDYAASMQNVQIWYILTSGRMPGQEMAAAMQEQAWVQLAMLRKAEAENIGASKQEVADQIMRLPIFFGQTGVFDRATYEARLGQIGMVKSQVDAAVRDQVVIRKLMAGSLQASLVTPDELERAYHLYTDRLVFEYAVLPREQIAETVSVTREEAEAFFADNRERFRMPAKVSVSYVEFPVADYLDQVEIEEGLTQQWYNQNMELYRIESTNDSVGVEYKSFEEVEDEVTEQVREILARNKAVETATALVADIAPKGRNEQPDFAGAVAAAGLVIKKLPSVGPRSELPGIDPTAQFKRAALRLQDDQYSSFSDAVPGKDTVYVLSLDQRYESFLPEFELVEDDVMEATKAQAVNEALADRSLEVRDTLAVVLEGGKSFKEAVAPLGLTVHTTEEFDMSTSSDDEYADQLIATGIDAEEGELCTPVPVADGVLFSYLAQRIVSDPELGMAAVREELVDALGSVQSRRLAESWTAALMEEADLQLK